MNEEDYEWFIEGLYGGIITFLECVSKNAVCVRFCSKKTCRKIYFDKKKCQLLQKNFEHFAKTLED